VQNDEVWIDISDTGKGIPTQNIKRIFEPFFTTKPVGVGTGLGLSLSYSIMQKHHGRIEVESEVGKGTQMRLCLPINSQPELTKVL
jgi:signal transduction histidine kinase